MAATKPTLTVWPASTLLVLSKGKNLASCRSSGARKLNCSLTSRLRRRSASPSRCPCPAAPTRRSSEATRVYRAVLLGLIHSLLSWADRKGDQWLGRRAALVSQERK